MEKSLWAIYKVFFKIGLLLLGGGYVILPLLQSEVAEKRGWVSDDELCEYYALSQSLPGVIAVNVATFVGYKLLGQKGAITATLGMITTPFLAIVLIANLLSELVGYRFVNYIFAGVGVGLVVLVMLAVREMWEKCVVDNFTRFIFILAFVLAVLHVSPVKIILMCVCLGIMRRIRLDNMSRYEK